MTNRSVPLILCIDDDEDTRNLLQYLLKHGNYEVKTAADGRQGIQLAVAYQPDIILLDIEMPGLNGYEVCLHLQRDPITAYIPVVFLTVRKSEQDRKKAFAAGGADFLTKPFQLNPLLETIQRQLERKANWQHLKELQAAHVSPSSLFLQFKNTVARKFDFSSDRYEQWLQVAPLQIYQRAFDFGFTHQEMAQLIAESLSVPYTGQIGPGTIRMGVLPTSFSKEHFIVAVDEDRCAVNFILSNPFDASVHGAMKKCMGPADAIRYAITEPGTISVLFERQPGAAAAVSKGAVPPAATREAPGGLSPRLPGSAVFEPPGAKTSAPKDAPHIQAPLTFKPAESPVSVPASAPAGPGRTAPPSILVVDDDADMQALEHRILSSVGYEVTTAGDGVDALLQLEKRPFDLVISDVGLPDVDGLKLLKIMREKKLDTPVLLVTALPGQENEVRGLKLGAEDYIRKPINKDVLLLKVKKVLAQRRPHRRD